MTLRFKVLAIAGALLIALPSYGQQSRPRPNPMRAAEASVAFQAPSPQAQNLPAPSFIARPKARPASIEASAPAVSNQTAPASSAQIALADQGMGQSLRPKRRPEALGRTASSRPAQAAGISAASAPIQEAPAISKSNSKASAKGSVCGVAAIKGEVIADIRSKVQGCGLTDGVRVTSVSGVRLSMAATIDCTTAKALNRWVESVAQPAYGGKIVELKLAGHYVCRPRNNKRGAKVSEHGRGKAVDISGFVLSNGKTHRVLGGFDKVMRKAHKGACGIFGTTLGPGSDGYHEDHLHFDTARHSNGAYCR